MLYLQHTITLGIFSLLTWGCGNSDKQKGEAEQAPLADKVWYSNPVIDSDNPDPTVIKAEDGYFYLYATGGNTWIHKSKDLVHWTYVGGAYEDDKKPSWEPEAGIWAPDINYINGKYALRSSNDFYYGSLLYDLACQYEERLRGRVPCKGRETY